MSAVVHLGDCLEVMRGMADNSVDSIVTDPPYGLSFMGRKWDHDVPSEAIWREALRVLKPGGHLLSFFGSRTYHRGVVRIEDAGFEIRDQIMWVYGSGFPKSLDVSKTLDKMAGAEREVLGPNLARHGGGLGTLHGGGIGAVVGQLTAPATDAAKQWQGWGTALKPSFEPLVIAVKPANTEQGVIDANLLRLEARLWSLLFVGAAGTDLKSNPQEQNAALAIAQWTAEEVTSTQVNLFAQTGTRLSESVILTNLSIVSSWRSILADHWNAMSTSTTETKSSTTTDWKTLSYCSSVITPGDTILALSLLSGQSLLASNAAKYFCAALRNLTDTLTLSALGPVTSQEAQSSLDVDARVKHEPIVLARKPLIGTVAQNVLAHGTGALNIDGCRITTEDGQDRSRPPRTPNAILGGGKGANLTASEHNAVGRWPANFIHDGSDEVLALFPETKPSRANTIGDGRTVSGAGDSLQLGKAGIRTPENSHSDSGSAARFFYCSKASRKDRGEGNTHATVKPTDLMRYLVRLITPPMGTVLDPFCGSGSTLKAAILEGFNCIGIELDADYVQIARAQIANAQPALLGAS